jgi:3'-phosphoadenosine 5'-phosphosulfate sulfotransferase (PAPS reductase)/FAD synthetase
MFPSSGQRFCTDFLKVKPINVFQESALEESDRVVTWLGIRADESAARSTALEWEREFGPADNAEAGLWKYRPILNWKALEVFSYIASKGLKQNPLYTQGMSRVGCMPCIMVRKSELSEIAKRFPSEIERIKKWEELVSSASKRGDSTIIQAKSTRRFDKQNITHLTHGIEEAVKWANTTRGGRQMPFDFGGGGGCSSVYGLCEIDSENEKEG